MRHFYTTPLIDRRPSLKFLRVATRSDPSRGKYANNAIIVLIVFESLETFLIIPRGGGSARRAGRPRRVTLKGGRIDIRVRVRAKVRGIGAVLCSITCKTPANQPSKKTDVSRIDMRADRETRSHKTRNAERELVGEIRVCIREKGSN